MILDKINEIIEEEGKCIIVLKGIDSNIMPIEKKYFSFNIDHYDNVALETFEEIVIDEIILKRTFEDDFKWMTIEEFQLFKLNQSINKMPVCLIQNNLYYNQYPYSGTLSRIEEIYQDLYYQEDIELSSEQLKVHETVTFFYDEFTI